MMAKEDRASALNQTGPKNVFAIRAREAATLFDPVSTPEPPPLFGITGHGVIEGTQQALVLYHGNADRARLAQQISAIRAALYATRDEAEQEWLSRRLCRLDGIEIEILVHSASDLESRYLNDLACCSLHATRAVIASGGVPGGGVAYLRCAAVPSPHQRAPQAKQAAAALSKGLEAPFRCLCERVAFPFSSRHQADFADPRKGFDAIRGALVDFTREGPMDSARVVKAVIGHAGEAASAVLEESAGSLLR
jgi:chaperonin GroEL